MSATRTRISYLFLCAVPFLNFAVVGVRALRIPGVYEVVGCILFAAIGIAAWTLGVRVIPDGLAAGRRLALAGTLLILPFSLVSLLWVGLGAPFQATAAENHMRYVVLLTDALVVAVAFVILKEELDDTGERFYSTIGFATSIPAGAAYFICIALSTAGSILLIRGEKTPSAHFLNEFYSVLEFVACVMTYLTTAAFAASLGRARWLGRGAARAYMTISAVSVLLVVVSGISYPEISGRVAPWYTQPGVIVRIPAVPWLMPCLLGVVLLRRAGEANQKLAAAHDTALPA
jgi:hypothetical protein